MRQLLVILSCYLSVNGAFSQTDTPHSHSAEVVQDLRYGVALYHFYQQSYIDALTELMVGEKVGDLSHHQNSANLLRGGISLSYGLDQVAEPIFRDFLSQYRGPKAQDQAWFYLAKLQYKQQAWSSTEASLGKISGSLPDDFSQESLFMRANIALKEADIETADALAEEFSESSIWLSYYWYNKGSLLADNQQWLAAINAFDNVRKTSNVTDESSHLFDKSQIAAGYAALARGSNLVAIAHFREVRKDSPFVTQALLGYGWAQLNRKAYEAALSPWQLLNTYSPLDPAVQESFLAIPFAYEKIDAKAEALSFYEKSVLVLNDELEKIQRSIAYYQQKSINDLFFPEQVFSEDWFFSDTIPVLDEHVFYLGPLLSTTEFQQALRVHRDLANLLGQLQDNSERLTVMDNVQRDQQNTWDALYREEKHIQLAQRYEQLSTIRSRLANEYQRALDVDDYASLSAAKDKDIQRRISRAENTLSQLQLITDVSPIAKEKIRLFKGLSVWNLSDNSSVRVWQIKKELLTLDKLLVETGQRKDKVLSIVDNRNANDFSVRIDFIKQRNQEKMNKLSLLYAQSEQNLRTLAVKALQQQKKNVANYIGQAKLSVARLYDEGSATVAPASSDSTSSDSTSADESSVIEQSMEEAQLP